MIITEIQYFFSKIIRFQAIFKDTVEFTCALEFKISSQHKDLKPDFMPERMDGYCDIMEFKMPHLDGKCIVGTNERICLIML